MDGEGFEPSKASLTDLQSAPFGHSGTHPYYQLINQLKADDRTRTDNLLITSQLLCQLSHIGILSYSMQSYVLRPTALPIKFINKFYLKLSHIGITKQKLDFNGTYRARTYDPLLVRQMLSQLS